MDSEFKTFLLLGISLIFYIPIICFIGFWAAQYPVATLPLTVGIFIATAIVLSATLYSIYEINNIINSVKASTYFEEFEESKNRVKPVEVNIKEILPGDFVSFGTKHTFYLVNTVGKTPPYTLVKLVLEYDLRMAYAFDETATIQVLRG